MLRWAEFQRVRPDLAEAGRRLLYQFGVGLAFLATVRADGGPRLHPICPLVTDDALLGFLQPSPKRGDLRRDGRYALHAFPPDDNEDAFYLSGRAVPVDDRTRRRAATAQFLAERKLQCSAARIAAPSGPNGWSLAGWGAGVAPSASGAGARWGVVAFPVSPMASIAGLLEPVAFLAVGQGTSNTDHARVLTTLQPRLQLGPPSSHAQNPSIPARQPIDRRRRPDRWRSDHQAGGQADQGGSEQPQASMVLLRAGTFTSRLVLDAVGLAGGEHGSSAVGDRYGYCSTVRRICSIEVVRDRSSATSAATRCWASRLFSASSS
jgi:hypothetical protein